MKLTWQRIIADRKKFGFLCGLLLVGLLLWARIIVIERPPRTAVADPSESELVDNSTTSDNETIVVKLDSEPNRNPFSVSSVVFPFASLETDNDYDKNRDAQDISVQDIVSNLVLDAVMGQIAMIDGKVYNVGDVVNGQNVTDPLILLEVDGRSVIISTRDRRYELTIVTHTPK